MSGRSYPRARAARKAKARATSTVRVRSQSWRDRLGLDRPDLSRGTAWSSLVVVLLVAASRAPYVLFEGRLWAEEARYLRQAMLEPGPGVLVERGHESFLLHLRLSTWLASYVPLEWAPLVTAWLSIAVVVAIVVVVLFWPSRVLPNGWSRLAAAALLVVGPVAYPEIWATATNSQTYLGVLVLVLAFVPVASLSRAQYATGAGLLGLAGLSGIYAAVLAPLYWIEAWRERSRRAIGYAAIMTVTAGVQAVSLLTATTKAKRVAPTAGELLESLAQRQLDAFVLGHTRGRWLLGSLGTSGRDVALAALAAALVVFLVVLVVHLPRRVVALELGVAFVLVEAAIQYGALSRPVGGRYVVLPIAVLTLTAIHGAATADRRWLRRGAAALCLVVLVAGLQEYWTFRSELLRCEGCPDWGEQVEGYEAGQTSVVEIWPYSGEQPWTIALPPASQAG